MLKYLKSEEKKEMIIKSFKLAGITLAIDGSEDGNLGRFENQIQVVPPVSESVMKIEERYEVEKMIEEVNDNRMEIEWEKT